MQSTLALIFFIIAIIHSLLVIKLSEFIFGAWALLFIFVSFLLNDTAFVIDYLSSLHYSEILIVVVMMIFFSLPYVERIAEKILINLCRKLPFPESRSTFFVLMTIAPLLGSMITEPAAMTITALLLRPRFFTKHHSQKIKYALMALLFINISIGGTLTPFAAPPIVMVASKWGWDLAFMLNHFALRTIISLWANTLLVYFIFKKEIDHSFVHHQNEMKVAFKWSIKEPLLVGFFLWGIVVLGGAQEWWLRKLLPMLSQAQLYIGSIVFTSVTDNAALTYLGSLVRNLSGDTRVLLVKGSMVGGGLTLIANAPNPIGFELLKNSFDNKKFSFALFFRWSLLFVIVPSLIYWL